MSYRAKSCFLKFLQRGQSKCNVYDLGILVWKEYHLHHNASYYGTKNNCFIDKIHQLLHCAIKYKSLYLQCTFWQMSQCLYDPIDTSENIVGKVENASKLHVLLIQKCCWQLKEKSCPYQILIHICYLQNALCFFFLNFDKSLLVHVFTLSQTSLFFYVSKYKFFETTVGKREIAYNEQFPLFPQRFLPFWRTCCHFHQI